MITTLTQTCPACGNKLRSLTEWGITTVYCSAGRCPSEKSNFGVKGTEPVEELAQKLIVIVEDDRSWD